MEEVQCWLGAIGHNQTLNHGHIRTIGWSTSFATIVRIYNTEPDPPTHSLFWFAAVLFPHQNALVSCTSPGYWRWQGCSLCCNVVWQWDTTCQPVTNNSLMRVPSAECKAWEQCTLHSSTLLTHCSAIRSNVCIMDVSRHLRNAAVVWEVYGTMYLMPAFYYNLLFVVKVVVQLHIEICCHQGCEPDGWWCSP